MERDNQDLVTQLAQARQQTRVSEDQLAAVREQLRTATSQLAQTQTQEQQSEQKAQALSASLHRQGGVSISPNNSYLQTLPVIRSTGRFVRRDGDVIRVELPGNRLFDSGGAQLRPGRQGLIIDAAAELRRNYPDQIIGIEGHTDSDPIVGGQFRNNHEFPQPGRQPSTTCSPPARNCGPSNSSWWGTGQTTRSCPTVIRPGSNGIAASSWWSTPKRGDDWRPLAGFFSSCCLQ